MRSNVFQDIDDVNEVKPSTFPCELCEYVSCKVRHLVDHHARAHEARMFKCTVCSKLFAMQKDLNQHFRFHTQRFYCDQCG